MTTRMNNTINKSALILSMILLLCPAITGASALNQINSSSTHSSTASLAPVEQLEQQVEQQTEGAVTAQHWRYRHREHHNQDWDHHNHGWDNGQCKCSCLASYSVQSSLQVAAPPQVLASSDTASDTATAAHPLQGIGHASTWLMELRACQRGRRAHCDSVRVAIARSRSQQHAVWAIRTQYWMLRIGQQNAMACYPATNAQQSVKMAMQRGQRGLSLPPTAKGMDHGTTAS